ncbi:MAG TPA: Do family serine endopeptidase [Candidatus Acidoferrum sp.]|nr:Do family serine endopeptidase [Candidatus Acidoferrum sp.]
MMHSLRPAAVFAVALLAATLSSASFAAAPIVGADGQVPTLAPLLKEVTPAVVNIATKGHEAVNPLYNDPLFRRFYKVPEGAEQRETQAAGSGVIIDAKEGYVVTNNHVIEKADEIVVTLKDNRQLKAKLVGADPETDVAVLKIEPKNLTALDIGDSDKLQVGDFVVAIGNPFGLGQTVTSGIVSALGRTGLGIESYENFIQTDASINPGNSGGALINLRGELIGINTAIVGPSGGNVGIGFAVPINMARAVIQQLIAHGEVKRGRLGVEVEDLTPDIAEALHVEASGGAVIKRVEPGSPARRAGLQAGDVVLAVDGTPIQSSSDLRNRVGLTTVGQTVQLTILRHGSQQTISVQVESAS